MKKIEMYNRNHRWIEPALFNPVTNQIESVQERGIQTYCSRTGYTQEWSVPNPFLIIPSKYGKWERVYNYYVFCSEEKDYFILSHFEKRKVIFLSKENFIVFLLKNEFPAQDFQKLNLPFAGEVFFSSNGFRGEDILYFIPGNIQKVKTEKNDRWTYLFGRFYYDFHSDYFVEEHPYLKGRFDLDTKSLDRFCVFGDLFLIYQDYDQFRVIPYNWRGVFFQTSEIKEFGIKMYKYLKQEVEENEFNYLDYHIDSPLEFSFAKEGIIKKIISGYENNPEYQQSVIQDIVKKHPNESITKDDIKMFSNACPSGIEKFQKENNLPDSITLEKALELKNRYINTAIIEKYKPIIEEEQKNRSKT